MVKVRLVENRVNRNVGIVIVENVMSQYRMPGMTFMRKSVILPNIPSHDLEVCPSGCLVPVATASAEAAVEFILLSRAVFCKVEATDSAMEVVANGTLVAGLAAIMTTPFLLWRENHFSRVDSFDLIEDACIL
jgi:hypothetical protein